MNTKNLFGFLIAIALVLFVTTGVSAAGELTSNPYIEVEGSNPYLNNVSVVAGDVLTLKVWFTADVADTDVRVKAELEGEKISNSAISDVFDVEQNQRYRKVLTIAVPYELRDQVSNELTLTVTIDGKEYKTKMADATLSVQRPSYNADIMSISTPQTITAGDIVTVDVVLKNVGYNQLDDLYLTAKIPALNVQKSSYVGDLISIEQGAGSNKEDNTVSARIYLQIPYEAVSGLYSLEVEITNDDLVISESKQIAIGNDFANNLIISEYQKTFNTGESAQYQLLLVNPTDSVKIYRIVTDSDGSLNLGLSNTLVAIQPDSSATVTLTASAKKAGKYSFNIAVFSGEKLVGQATLGANNVEGKATNTTDAVVILTIVLAIIFLVLLAVLIVLLKKRPEKTEEFGESYY